MRLRCPDCSQAIQLKGERPYGKTVRLACPRCRCQIRAKVPAMSEAEAMAKVGDLVGQFAGLAGRPNPLAGLEGLAQR